MKFNFTFTALMTALLVLTLFSCKDDADEATLVGTWRISSIAATNCPDSSDNGTTTADANGDICESFLETSFCSSLSLTFTETAVTTVGTTTTTIDGVTTTETDTSIGTYTVDGDQITVCEGSPADCETSTFTLSKTTFTITTTEDGDCDTVITAIKQ